MSRTCSVVDSIDCKASSESMIIGPVVVCWACGDDTCRECSSIVTYRWRGQNRRMRWCFTCQDTRNVGRGAPLAQQVTQVAAVTRAAGAA